MPRPPGKTSTFDAQLRDDLLMWIWRHLRFHGFAPSTTAIARAFGVSVGTPSHWLRVMEEEGLLMLQEDSSGRMDAKGTRLSPKAMQRVAVQERLRASEFAIPKTGLFIQAPLAYFLVRPTRVIHVARGELLLRHGIQPQDIEFLSLHEVADTIGGFVPAVSAALEHEHRHDDFTIGGSTYPAYAGPYVDPGGRHEGAIAMCFDRPND